jgi:hypothetical protein
VKERSSEHILWESISPRVDRKNIGFKTNPNDTARDGPGMFPGRRNGKHANNMRKRPRAKLRVLLEFPAEFSELGKRSRPRD